MRRLLVIGLDGATWDMLRPLTNSGELPAFKQLMDTGTWGGLTSTTPPVSGSAWLSLATGRNPGKTGIFGFAAKSERGYHLTPITSNSFRGRSFWDYLSDDGGRVGVVNVPMLFPPYRINGFMLGGVGSPKGEPITFPSKLWTRIDSIAGGYELYVPYSLQKYDDEDLFISDVERVLAKRTRVILDLMQQEDWDLFFAVISCTDWVQHLMWKHVDQSHPLYDPVKSRKYGRKFVEFWQRIDQLVAQMADTAGPHTNVLIVSDHGFGAQSGCFNLSKWLNREGFLVKSRSKLPRFAGGLSRLTTNLASAGRILPKRVRAGASSFLRDDVRRHIDFGKSRAYVLGHDISFGGIYLQTPQPREASEAEPRSDRLRQQVLTAAARLQSELGDTVSVQTFDSSEIYWGDCARLAPDIILTIDEWACAITEQDFDGPVFKPGPYSNRYTGSHRMNGVFLAHGPDIKKSGRVSDARIYDVAPTILHILGVAIPTDMDGRVLRAMFDGTSELAMREVSYSEVGRPPLQTPPPSAEDDQRVREHLRGLGYLE